MKRFICLLITVMTLTVISAQNITDGLRYAYEDPYGSARFTALSGAFGALGGDFSAISINPAGSAVFSGNGSSVSFSVHNRSNNTNYFNTSTKSGESRLNLNQA